MSVRKAVIPAAGLGTRFLPATKALPKEMIPVVDKPRIQYAVEEATRAGIRDILVITSRGKAALEDHFDHAPELEGALEAKGKTDELEQVRRVSELADVHYVRQQSPLGFGHAVGLARSFVGDEGFAVLVPDEIVPEPVGDEVALLPEMIDAHQRHGGSVVMVQEVPASEVSSYGIIDPEPVEDRVVRVKRMVEKPARDSAPSRLGSRGRYVLTADLFDALERIEPGVGGELQLTDAINLRAEQGDVFAYIHDGPILDVGRKLDHVKATVQLALRRDDLAVPLRQWLDALLSDAGNPSET